MKADSIFSQPHNLLSNPISPFNSAQSYQHLKQLNPIEQQIFRSIQHLQLKAFMKGLPWGEQAKREANHTLFHKGQMYLMFKDVHSKSLYSFISEYLNKIEPLYQISEQGGYFKSFKKLNAEMNSIPHSIIATDQGDYYEIIHQLTPDIQKDMHKQHIDIDSDKITLGSGIYSQVSLGRDMRTHELVALKKFDEIELAEEELEQFDNIENAQGCKEGLIQRRGMALIQENGVEKAYMVLPLFNRGDGSKQLSSPQLRETARHYITAVHHLHGLGLAHRDVRLKNFLHSTQIGIALADFGISQPFGEIIMKFGTPGYMPPEKFKPHFTGKGQDCFALGRVLLELKHKKEDLASINCHHLDVMGHKITLEFDKNGECLGVPSIAGFEPHQAKTYDEVIAGLLAADPLKRIDTGTALNTPYYQY